MSMNKILSTATPSRAIALWRAGALCLLLASCGEAPPPPDHAAPAAVADTVKAPVAAEPKADPDAMPVTVDNFCRAETDMYFGAIVKKRGMGVFGHERDAVPADKQDVVRLNRDTYYSSGVFDLDAGPVTITMPDAKGRFQSLIAIDNDHYIAGVTYSAGAHTFTRAKVGTRYVLLGVRTFVDPNDAADVQQAHTLQDGITVSQPGGPGTFQAPKWDMIGQQKVREALDVLGSTLVGFDHAFGTRAEVDPIRHLIGTARGWGGNPDRDARYDSAQPEHNDGRTPYVLHVKDVPVDGFWSITVYNAKGFYEAPENTVSVNNLTAKKDPDGGITVHFGGDPQQPNYLHIMDGWNYTVRMYRPRKAILDGTWKFPQAQPL